MASPQAEDGHVDISNEIVEILARQTLSPNEWRCLMVILRKTWGWHKKTDWISLSQFVLMTGMKKPNVCRGLSKLKSKNIIIRTDNDKGKSYRFQKDYEKWKPLSKLIMLSEPITTVIRSDNETLSDPIPTKEKIQKKLLQEALRASFDIFYKAYPKHKARKDAFKAWEKINPSPEEGQIILTALEKQKASEDWLKDNGRYIPLPATWLNGRRWEDEIQEPKSSW